MGMKAVGKGLVRWKIEGAKRGRRKGSEWWNVGEGEEEWQNGSCGSYGRSEVKNKWLGMSVRNRKLIEGLKETGPE